LSLCIFRSSIALIFNTFRFLCFTNQSFAFFVRFTIRLNQTLIIFWRLFLLLLIIINIINIINIIICIIHFFFLFDILFCSHCSQSGQIGVNERLTFDICLGISFGMSYLVKSHWNVRVQKHALIDGGGGGGGALLLLLAIVIIVGQQRRHCSVVGGNVERALRNALLERVEIAVDLRGVVELIVGVELPRGSKLVGVIVAQRERNATAERGDGVDGPRVAELGRMHGDKLEQLGGVHHRRQLEALEKKCVTLAQSERRKTSAFG
jgi:hypothetical protein